MKGLKCTDQTRILSMVLFTLYFLYGMFKIPFLEYVSCIALCAIIYGITNSIEFGVLALLIANLILPIFRSSKEGFKDKSADEAKPKPAPEKAEDEASPGPEQAVKTKQPVTGLVSEATNVVSETKEFSGTSTPASAKGANTNVKQINEKVPPANQPADLVKDGFNGGSGGLFKLGEIPTDEKGGYHIDAGTSVLNALKSLKPDQISAMTQDTKQLIETQKTLMNMLQSFKPMMAEGKDMMDTFQQMFSPKDGSAMGALQAAQNTLNN
jgi:hypothetical protein